MFLYNMKPTYCIPLNKSFHLKCLGSVISESIPHILFAGFHLRGAARPVQAFHTLHLGAFQLSIGFAFTFVALLEHFWII